MSADTQAVFEKIYALGLWGKADGMPYFSGSGSHDPRIVDPYVECIKQYFSMFRHFYGRLPDVIDLGCGDFSVGSRIQPLTRKYTALDAVPSLIEYNKNRFSSLPVTFVAADAKEYSYPSVDIVMVRQVFQHLPNANIAAILGRIAGAAQHLIITEHLPAHDGFVPNAEIPAVGSWRLSIYSGVQVTQPPFSLGVVDERQLCVCEESGGRIVTTAFRLPTCKDVVKAPSLLSR